jgi:hypothetical protein
MVLGVAQPGARLLRENIVVIFVVIFIGVFLSYMDTLQDDIEVVAVEKTINEINRALALTLYQHAVEGRLGDLPLLEGENPFAFLSIYKQLPVNYRGSVRNSSTARVINSWYYNLDARRVTYQADTGEREFALVFQYKDRNNNGVFDASIDTVSELVMAEQ